MARKTFTKQALYDGTYHSPDADIEVTPERRAHWEEVVGQISGENYVIPVHFDHTDDPNKALPLSSNKFKKKSGPRETVGRLSGFENKGDHAILTFEVSDDNAKKKMEDNDLFISPVLFEKWTSGKKTQYEDMIGSVDLVDYPVDFSQGDFKEVPSQAQVAMSCIRMSTDDKSIKSYTMAIPTDPDEEPMTPEPALEPIISDVNDDDDPNNPMSKMGIGEAITNDLKMAGIAPPEGMNPIENPLGFLRQLCAALRQKQMDDGVNQEENSEDLFDDVNEMGSGGTYGKNNRKIEETNPGVSSMSTETKQTGQQKDTDNPDSTGQTSAESQQRMSTLEKKADDALKAANMATEKLRRAESRLVDSGKERILTQLNDLMKSGRCTPDEHKTYSSQLTTIKMSLTEDGSLSRTEIQQFVDNRRDLPRGACWPSEIKMSLDGAAETSPPTEVLNGENTSQEDLDKHMEDMQRRHPGQFADAK